MYSLHVLDEVVKKEAGIPIILEETTVFPDYEGIYWTPIINVLQHVTSTQMMKSVVVVADSTEVLLE